MRTGLFFLAYLLVAVSCNSDILFDSLEDVDDRASKLKEEILNSKSCYESAGAVYYVSQSGSDANDGLSPRRAFKTLEKVNDCEFKPGDVVLFRRGDLWRGHIRTRDGVTYSAYGRGEKPKLYGSPFDAAVTGEWTETDVDDVYAFSIPVGPDVGTLVFDEGKSGCAYKVIQKMYPDSSLFHIETELPFNDYHDITRNLDFFHDPNDSVIYLRCEKGNPAEVFKSIELNTYGHGFTVNGGAVKIDNFCIKYVGSHGIGAVAVKSLDVTNCEIGWIGGSIQFYKPLNPLRPVSPTRFGNGVELWAGCGRYLVDHNYVYQVYDAGITNQFDGGSVAVVEENVTYSSNLVEDCVYSLEYFMSEPSDGNEERAMKDICVTDNIFRRAGYGWGIQRPNKKTCAVIKSWRHRNEAYGFEIKGNIFDRSKTVLMQVRAKDPHWLPYCHDNLYVMTGDMVLGETPEKSPEIIVVQE